MLFLKGIAGNAIPLVTIADADVLFFKYWQSETTKIFDQSTASGRSRYSASI
jgi:hypothetical protein